MFISLAFLRTFYTVLRDTLQLSTIFRALKFRLCSLMISQYLVMVLTLLIMYLHQSVYSYSIRNLCNGFHKSGIMISLCRSSGFHHRNSGSQNPDRWLKRSWNTQMLPLCLMSEDNLKEKLAEEHKLKAEYAKKVGQLTMQVDWLKKKSEEICGPDYESKFSPKPFNDKRITCFCRGKAS